MTVMKLVQHAQGAKAELTRPLYTIGGDAAQAKADAKALDAALGTSCLSAVNRHLAAEDQVEGEEKIWGGNIASFFASLVGLIRLLEKEKGKPPEQQSHGAYVRDAKGLLGDAERDLARIERTLGAWEKARSDLVAGLAAAKKALPKNADKAAKAGTGAAKKEHQALVSTEAQLRVWAFKQGEAIESAKKQLHKRLNEARTMRGLFDTIPPALGTPI